MAVRPEFGPTLPALLRARGLRGRTVLLGVLALAAVVAAVAYAAASSGPAQATVRGPQTFNLVYDTSVLHRVAPHPGELLRLAGSRRNVSVVVAVQTAHLPAYPGGDAVGGLLPVLAERRESRLRALYGPLQIFDEGKARTSGAPGYQVGFGAGRGPHRIFGRDVYAFPTETAPRVGVLLTLRQYVRRNPTAADKAFLKSAKDALHSFTFGEDSA